MPDAKEVTDVLGLAPYGETLNTLAKGMLEGAGAFLSRICLPASEEFGLLLKDKVSNWRKQNAVRITLMAKEIIDDKDNRENMHAHPRLVMKIMEEGSWSDSSEIQNMWAGLLASSCTKSGKDESNLMFINILSRLTSAEAKLINHFSGKCEKKLSPCGLIQAEGFNPSLEELLQVSDLDDHEQVDVVLDHLRSIELISPYSGFDSDSQDLLANIEVSALALNLYARCKGWNGSVNDFFNLQKEDVVEGEDQQAAADGQAAAP
jgi:hypothetical protein